VMANRAGTEIVIALRDALYWEACVRRASI
jgi:hypothetical protein